VHAEPSPAGTVLFLHRHYAGQSDAAVLLHVAAWFHEAASVYEESSPAGTVLFLHHGPHSDEEQSVHQAQSALPVYEG
jgi:hypothetical protein